MKYINSILMVLAIAFMATSCSQDEESYTPGEPAAVGCQQAIFATTAYTNIVELEPGETYFDIELKRIETSSAGTVNLNVVNNGDNVFVVPATASFDAGAATTNVRVTFPGADEGIAYKLVLALEGDNVSPYTDGYREATFNMTILKWENIGTGYYLDGTVSAFFGVDPAMPMAVELQKATTSNSTRFRFDSPFARVATAKDDAGGYDGYPYNEAADVVPGNYRFVIDVTTDGATLIPTEMGMDWGYGMFTCGTALGYYQTSSSSYPLGKLAADVITFPANSLFILMADYNSGAPRYASAPSYLYLTKKAYLDSLGGDEEDDEEEEG